MASVVYDATYTGLVRRFPGPIREDPLVGSMAGPGRGRGRGLFGNSQVWVSETGAPTARRLLSAKRQPDRWTLPHAAATRQRHAGGEVAKVFAGTDGGPPVLGQRVELCVETLRWADQVLTRLYWPSLLVQLRNW